MTSSSRFLVKPQESLTGARTITFPEIESYQGFNFAPTAARDVSLPAEEACKGTLIMIFNTAGGAYALTVKNDAAGTVCTINQNKAALLFCDGTSWLPLSGA